MTQWKASITGKQRVTPIPVAPGLASLCKLPVPFTATGDGLDLTGSLDLVDGRFVLSEVTVRSAEGVTGERLRRIPVGDIVRTLALDIALAVRPTGSADGSARMEPLGYPPAGRGKGPTDEQLRYARSVWRFAKAVGDPPTQTVAKEMGVSVPTATRWIARAGLIEEEG